MESSFTETDEQVNITVQNAPNDVDPRPDLPHGVGVGSRSVL
jgi:hypothetical protein